MPMLFHIKIENVLSQEDDFLTYLSARDLDLSYMDGGPYGLPPKWDSSHIGFIPHWEFSPMEVLIYGIFIKIAPTQ